MCQAYEITPEVLPTESIIYMLRNHVCATSVYSYLNVM